MKLKYYIRGLGIGIMITAFLMGFNQSGQSEQLSNEEIISRAKKIGMYESVVVSDNTSNNEVEDSISNNEVEDSISNNEVEDSISNNEVEDILDEDSTSDIDDIVESTDVVITINSGEGSLSVCKKLVEAGLIGEATTYDSYLAKNGYDKRIKTGNHIIPIGSSEEEIANIISSK